MTFTVLIQQSKHRFKYGVELRAVKKFLNKVQRLGLNNDLITTNDAARHCG